MIRAPRLRTRASKPAQPVRRRSRAPRDNPSGRVLFFGYSPDTITVTINSGSPEDLVDELFWQMVVFLQQAFMKRDDPLYRFTPMMAAACALAHLQVRRLALRDVLIAGHGDWPSAQLRDEYQARVQKTLSGAASLLHDPSPDMDSVKAALQQALAVGLVMSSRQIHPTSVRSLFYIEALRGALRWRDEPEDEMRGLIQAIYRADKFLIPQQAAIQGAYQIGLELFEKSGRSRTNPFRTIPDDDLFEMFYEYLDDDMREYRHREANTIERQIAVIEFGSAQLAAMDLIFDPSLQQKMRPFDV